MTTTTDLQGSDLPDALDDRTREILLFRRADPSSRRRGWLVHRAFAAADAVGLLVAFFASLALFPAEASLDRVTSVTEMILFVISLPVWIALFKLRGLYDQDGTRMDHSTVDDIAGVFVVVTIGTWVTFLVVNVTNYASPSVARLTGFWLIALLSVPFCRVIARTFASRSLAYVQNTVVVGTGPVGQLFAHKILGHPEYGLNLVGFIDPGSTGEGIGSIPLLGVPSELRGLIPALDIERVIVAFTDDSPEQTIALVRELRDFEVQIDIVPRLYEVVGTNSWVHMVEGMPLVGLPALRLSPSSRFLKRLLDISLAALGLLVLSPLLAVAAVAVRLDSPGPAFFRQVRRGTRESTFEILKFRTMAVDAESKKREVAHLNMHGELDPRMFKVPGDPRVTRVGRFLRRWSIDELPQLVNVLKGEMSLVGPRPLILDEDQYVVDWARKRVSLKPGVTGLWQVLGRSDIPFDEMTKLDFLYVTSWSLKEDLRLILLTLPSLFRKRQAF